MTRQGTPSAFQVSFEAEGVSKKGNKMKKRDYLRLKRQLETQGPLGPTYQECIEMDKFLKEATLQKLEKNLASKKMNILDREFILMMVRFHFGSMEIDSYLSSTHSYPSEAELPKEA